MRQAILALVLVMMVTLGGALDYSLAAKTAGPDYGFGAHLNVRTSFVQNLLPQSDLARALPAPPPGWTMRAGRVADSITIAGLPVDPADLEQAQALEAMLVETIPGLQVERRTYEKGAQTIALDVSFVPANARGTQGAQVMEMIFSTLATQAAPPAGDDPFAPQHLTLAEFGAASLYFRVVEGQIFISALSSADEGTTRDLLHGLDRAALRQMIANDPTIGAEPVTEEPIAASEAPQKAPLCTTRGAAKFCGVGG